MPLPPLLSIRFCLFPDINSLVAYFKALRAPPVVSHILLLSSNALYCLFPDIYSLVARFKALRVPTIATNHKPRPPLLLYTSVHTFVSSLTSDHLPISYFKALRANDRRQLEAKVFQELGISELAFKRLPRALHQACWRGGWVWPC